MQPIFTTSTGKTFGESSGIFMGSQHPSPNVKTFCNFEPQIWLEIITSRDAKSACFKGSRTSCREIIFGIFWPNFGHKRSHHVMDASCRFQGNLLPVLFFTWCCAPMRQHQWWRKIGLPKWVNSTVCQNGMTVPT